MVVREIRKLLPEEAVVFDNPAFDCSIVGTTSDGGVVYDYDTMVRELIADDNINEEEAREFIDYKTLRSIPYASSYGTPPVVMYSMEKEIVEAVTYVED